MPPPKVWTPAPAPGATARQPLPPLIEAARREAERVGREYGKFKADLEQDFYMMFQTPYMGGIVLWDRMNNDERRKHLENVQREMDKLPKLPIATDLVTLAAIKEGFHAGANSAYEIERFNFRAVWVACELAKAVIVGKASMPTIQSVG